MIPPHTIQDARVEIARLNAELEALQASLDTNVSARELYVTLYRSAQAELATQRALVSADKEEAFRLGYAKFGDEMRAWLDAQEPVLKSKLERLEEQNKELKRLCNELLDTSGPFPLATVLRRLADAVAPLLWLDARNIGRAKRAANLADALAQELLSVRFTTGSES